MKIYLETCSAALTESVSKRQNGGARTYQMMWRRYKQRVLLAMSSQAFAQLVRVSLNRVLFVELIFCRPRMVSMVGLK